MSNYYKCRSARTTEAPASMGALGAALLKAGKAVEAVMKEAHPAVMQLRRAAAGGRAVVPGLCSAIPTPATTALRLWFWAGGEMDDEE